MSEEKNRKTVLRWWSRRLLIRTFLIGIAFFAALVMLANRKKPEEGYVFERLPALGGIYRCCDAGGRYSQSWIGTNGINCLGFSYYQLGTGRNDCGLKELLDGRPAVVSQILIPTIWGDSPLVVRISSPQEGVVYDVTDKEARQRWIMGSLINSITLAFILSAILHGAQLIFIGRKNVKPYGESK